MCHPGGAFLLSYYDKLKVFFWSELRSVCNYVFFILRNFLLPLFPRFPPFCWRCVSKKDVKRSQDTKKDELRSLSVPFRADLKERFRKRGGERWVRVPEGRTAGSCGWGGQEGKGQDGRGRGASCSSSPSSSCSPSSAVSLREEWRGEERRQRRSWHHPHPGGPSLWRSVAAACSASRASMLLNQEKRWVCGNAPPYKSINWKEGRCGKFKKAL